MVSDHGGRGLGAAGLKAIQYLDSGAPQDGSVITAFNPGMIAESLLNADKVRFKFTDVAWIGSITRDQRVCYAWAATADVRRSFWV